MTFIVEGYASMKGNLHLFMDIAGRMIYMTGTSLAIYFAAGGQRFIQKPIGIIYLILWNIWWAVTFLGRQRGKQTNYDLGKNWLVILSSIVAVPFLVLIPPLEYTGFTGPLPRDSLLSWLGLSVYTSGIVIQAIAMWQLRTFYTVRLGVADHQKLVTTGMYSSIRHPGYFSYLLSITGIGLSMSSLATLILAVAIFLFLKSRIASEEEMMITEFGDSYKQYMRKTRRLIPFVY